MARLEVLGVDQLMARVNRAGSMMRPIIEEALRQSAEELRKELLAQESRFKHPSGALGRSIEISAPWHFGNASGIYQDYVGTYTGPGGGGEKAGASGRRAAFVAAMQEYQNGNPFNNRARNKAATRINAIINEAVGDINKYLGSHGGGI